MKKILKIVLTVAFVAGSTSVFAQKLGRINMQELVFAMPETAEMQKNLEAYQKELQDQLETIGVEFNNKLNEYTKQVSDKNSTMSDSVRQLKEKELNDLKTRYDEFVQVSQQDMQKKQGELLEPIIVKAQDAVKEVSKAGGYTVVYDTSVNAVAYFDEAVVTDILPAVKTKLGIKDTPAAAPAAPERSGRGTGRGCRGHRCGPGLRCGTGAGSRDPPAPPRWPAAAGAGPTPETVRHRSPEGRPGPGRWYD